MDKYFKTKDLYLATTLKTLGFELLRINPVEGIKSYCEFIFDDPKLDAEMVEVEWFNRKLLVEPKLFEENLKDLRRRVSTP